MSYKKPSGGEPVVREGEHWRMQRIALRQGERLEAMPRAGRGSERTNRGAQVAGRRSELRLARTTQNFPIQK